MTDTTSVPLTALAAVSQGGVIVYPTEAVYGLGCDPDNQQAVERLLAIKQRSFEKALILISDNYVPFLKYFVAAKIPLDKSADIVYNLTAISTCAVTYY